MGISTKSPGSILVSLSPGNMVLTCGLSSAGFSLRGFVLAGTKTRRLKPALLDLPTRNGEKFGLRFLRLLDAVVDNDRKYNQDPHGKYSHAGNRFGDESREQGPSPAENQEKSEGSGQIERPQIGRA